MTRSRVSLAALRDGQGGAERLHASAILLLSDGASTTGVTVDVAGAFGPRCVRPGLHRRACAPMTACCRTVGGCQPAPEALGRLAEITDGQLYESRDADSVNAVYEELGSLIGTVRERDEVTAWPAALGLALLLLAGVAALALHTAAARLMSIGPVVFQSPGWLLALLLIPLVAGRRGRLAAPESRCGGALRRPGNSRPAPSGAQPPPLGGRLGRDARCACLPGHCCGPSRPGRYARRRARNGGAGDRHLALDAARRLPANPAGGRVSCGK